MALLVSRRGRAAVPALTGGVAGVLYPLVLATLLAAGAEVTLLRLTSRIGIHIPALTWARQGYTVAVNLGNYAFPMAVIFAAALLAALALALARRAPVAALATGALLLWQAWLRLGDGGATAVAIHAGLLALALAAVAASAAAGRGEPDPPVSPLPRRGDRVTGAGTGIATPSPLLRRGDQLGSDPLGANRGDAHGVGGERKDSPVSPLLRRGDQLGSDPLYANRGDAHGVGRGVASTEHRPGRLWAHRLPYALPAAARALPGVLLLLALLTVGQALGLLQAMSANLVGSGLALPAGLTVAGEFVLLALLLLAPWLVRPARWERRAVVAGIAAALLVAGMLAGNASTTRILALWTFGLAMPAPSLLYAVAAGLLTATAVARWRQGDRAVAAGLALVTLGGYVPPNSYQADLLIAGVILLAWPALLAAPERGTPVTAGAGN